MPSTRRAILRPLELERRDAPAVLSYTAPFGNGSNFITLQLNATGNKVELRDNGVLKTSKSLNGLSGIEITGAANENDTLIVDYSAGLFTVPITYLGGVGGNDGLEVIGTGSSTALYQPSASIPGNGTVLVGSTTIQFAELSPVTVSRMTSLTLTTPNGADVLTVDSPASGRTRISGSSGGVAIESLTFFDVGQMIVDVRVNSPAANDALAVTGPFAATGLVSFIAKVGTGTNSLDFSSSPQAITATIGTASTTVAFAGGGIPVAVIGTVSSVTGTPLNDTYIDQTTIEMLSLIDSGGDNNFVLDPGSTIDITGTGGGNNTIDFSRSPDPIVAEIGTTTTIVSEIGDDGTVIFNGSGGSTVGTVIGTTSNDRYIDQTSIQTLRLIDGGGNNYFLLDPSSTIDMTVTGGGNNTIDFSRSPDPIVADIGTTTVTVSEVGDDGHALFTGLGGSYVGTVIGTNGSDTLIDNTINNQTWDGGGGGDIFDAQPSSSITIVEDTSGGTDTILLNRAFHAVDVDLQAGVITDSNGNQVLIVDRQGRLSPGVENLSGTAFSDVIRGTTGDNVLFGAGGNDVFDGGGGNDTYVPILGGSVAIFDSGGIDTIDYSAGERGINLDLSRGNGSAQSVDGAGSTLSLFGSIENAIGTGFADSISGGSDNNILAGRGGNDRLMGQSGHDVLVGGTGDDELNGGSDRDVIVGGRGADRLNAGSGEDILIAGFTAYDTMGLLDQVDLAAWTAIRAAWITGDPVGDRIAAIRVGVGSQGQYRLTATGPGATVDNNDGAIDVLTGGQSADWFFAVLSPDVITDKDDSEFIN